jgi:hypothetical protein
VTSWRSGVQTSGRRPKGNSTVETIPARLASAHQSGASAA